MASAYATFANGGRHAEPIAVTKITDANGKVIKENIPQTTQALDEVAAFLVTDILKDVIRSGTGRRASIGRAAAGKTGTSEDYGDAWFVGYTPNLSTAVWVGYKDSRQSMTSVHGVKVFGGTFPADIWRKFMLKAHANIAQEDFVKPAKGIVGIKICKVTDLIASEFCTDTAYSTFARGTGPRRICDKHKAPPKIKVPNVIGTGVDQAKATLEQAGLAYNVKSVDRISIPAGQVTSQNPAEGSELNQGSQVELEVSTGHAPSGKVQIPAVIGLPLGQAQAVLADAGLKANIVPVNVKDSAKVGKVVDQVPKSGSQIAAGSIITISIGK
jgi:membrane peptidoglycan carboxypeptidase